MNAPRKIRLLMLAADFLATIVVFDLVSYFRGVPNPFIFWPLLIPGGLLIAAIYLIDGYRPRTDMQSLDYASLHIIAVISAMLVTLLLTFVFIPPGYELQSSRIVIVLSFCFLIPPTLGLRQLLQRRMRATTGRRSLLFLGHRESRALFREECRKMGVRQPVLYSKIGPTDDEEPGEELCSLGETLREIEEGRLTVEAIVLRESNRELPPETAQHLVQLYFRGIPTYTLELFYQVYWQKIPLYRLNPTWLFQEGFQIAREPVFERLKRASDIVFSIVGMALTAPLIAILGARHLARGPRSGVLPPDAHRQKPGAVPGRQASHDALGRPFGRSLHAPGRRARHRDRTVPEGPADSTSCPSFGTCFGAR